MTKLNQLKHRIEKKLRKVEKRINCERFTLLNTEDHAQGFASALRAVLKRIEKMQKRKARK